jgi:hypothetical protein
MAQLLFAVLNVLSAPIVRMQWTMYAQTAVVNWWSAPNEKLNKKLPPFSKGD